MAHATPADLAAYVAADTPLPSTAEQTRLLARASELVDDHVTSAYETDESGVATDEAILGALRDATCAQVEMWLSLGEAVDIETWPTTRTGQFKAGGVEVPAPPEKLAARAARVLRSEGLLCVEAI